MDMRDEVLHHLTVQFCTVTLSIGLAYHQKAHVACLAMRVIVLFGSCLAVVSYLLALLSLQVCISIKDFSYAVCLVGGK